ncbi:universal stress protein [Roseateles sp.]|uniref:universal stress protein n=1 Tax=Roseateles sp. TaxID=1971397 RepID=UPI0025F02FC1|nr:universal stress protein [Roseateles sp.]MBV8036876.1 universal stress protein [Roseateles sp.]
MAIRTILVNLDNGKHTRARVAAAAALAIQHDAHLVGLASTGWVIAAADVDGSLGLGAYQAAAMRELRELAQGCAEDFHQQVERLGVLSHEEHIELGYPADTMPRAARYCDLTVMTQTDPDDDYVLRTPHLAQDVLLQSGRPLLALPYAGEWTVAPATRVLVGWNASREAARAMQDAMPFLCKAASVEVVVFETPEDVDLEHGDVPGADIGLWLARHGVKVDVRYVATDVAAGEALLSHAANMGADLIVAGGYGHSRFREVVLGGVTRTLLHSSPVPVLLSH